MSGENKQTSDARGTEPSLSDTIYLALGIPEINAEISALFALQSKTLAILQESGLISKEQAEDIMNHAFERISSMCRSITDRMTSDKHLTDSVAKRMEKAAHVRLNKMRERLNLPV